MSDWMMQQEPPTPEQLMGWRKDALTEVERIGTVELAQRLKVPEDTLLKFLGGNDPPTRLQIALSVYDFGDYPDLTQLMMSYFHDSYEAVTGSLENWQSAVDAFVKGGSRGRVIGAAGDIRRFLTVTKDNRVQNELVRLGCCFAFRAIQATPRQWLEAVHSRLLETLDT